MRFVLYAWDDRPSQSLAKEKGIDLAGLDFEMPDYSDDVDDVKQYQYWGARLLVLADIIDRPDGFRTWMRKD